jgi:hypothetical protein
MLDGGSDRSGTFGFLVGLIVLVFTGVILSLLVDKRLGFSSDRLTVERETEADAAKLRTLERRLSAMRSKWEKELLPRSGQEDLLRRLSATQEAETRRLAELAPRKASVEAELEAVRAASAEYRASYRRQVRAAAAGERLAELKSLNGRTYREVTIRQVTADGIDFRHADGISRLGPSELDGTWRERFQWDPEEIPQAVAKAEPEAEPKAKPKTPAPPRKERPVPQTTEDELEELRAAVIATQADVDAALAEVGRSRSEAQTNRGRSVPGSLETWSERATRMEGVAKRLKTRNAAARARLAAVSPGDPALRIP